MFSDGSDGDSIGGRGAPVMEDSVQALQASPNATAALDLILDHANGDADALPIFVGHQAGNALRWSQMMTWLPGFVEQVGGLLFRVNCTREADAIQSAVDCHVLTARAALRHYGGQDGVYLDLDDNCRLAQRADVALMAQARHQLVEHPEWMFVQLSRLPVPIGLVNPHTCVDTPLWEPGDAVYRKLVGTVELAQAMLCHTDHAQRISSPTFVMAGAYEDAFSAEAIHVLYPSMIQRRTDSESSTNSTALFERGLGSFVRDVAFTPSVYTTVDFLNAHGGWVRTVATRPPRPARVPAAACASSRLGL